MDNQFNPGQMIANIEQALKDAGMPEEEAKRQATKQVTSMGAIKVATGNCPLGGKGPMSCMFCPFGHMTHCHHPLTCEEAKCSHYLQEREDASMGDETEKELLDVECCCGTGHTIREGGSHVNLIVLNKKAFSKFMVAFDFWLDGKERPPRAMAAICDSCAREQKKPTFALARDGDKTPIYRIPVAELGDWSYE